MNLLNDVLPEQVAKHRTVENHSEIWQGAMEKRTSNTNQNNEVNPMLPPQNTHSKVARGAEYKSPIAEQTWPQAKEALEGAGLWAAEEVFWL